VYLAKSKDDGVIFEALDKVEKLTEKMEALVEENKMLRAQADMQQKTKRKRKLDVSTDDSPSNSG
jgi:molecular chaperone GrpE (heat shock protein)